MKGDARVVFLDLEAVGWVLRSAVAPYEISCVRLPPAVHSSPGVQGAGQARWGVILDGYTDSVEHVRRVLDHAIRIVIDDGLIIGSEVIEEGSSIFVGAVRRARIAAGLCMYVSKDAARRNRALAAGMQVCPHIDLLSESLAGVGLCYLRINAPVSPKFLEVMSGLPFVPLKITAGAIYMLSTDRVYEALLADGIDIDLLGEKNDPLRQDMYLLYEHGLEFAGRSSGESSRRLMPRAPSASRSGGLVAFSDGGRNYFPGSVESCYSEKAVADPHLLSAWVGKRGPLADSVSYNLSAGERRILGEIDARSIMRHIEKYSGAKKIDEFDGATIDSRHVHNYGNWRAVRLMLEDMRRAVGGSVPVKLHQFTLNGSFVYNIEAELKGSTDEVVIVAAHLDSTAVFDSFYDSSRDPAPGADDDASGVAALVVIANALCRLAALSHPRRCVRFLLFNAEELGKAGSKEYAAVQLALGVDIVAVYQMDMIGYNKVPPGSFGVHAGYEGDQGVQNRSILLAEHICKIVPTVSSGLELPKIYPNKHYPSDPFLGKSDHASFQERHYPACMVAEDLLGEVNPGYHTSGDRPEHIDGEYASSIARAVAAAAWILAR